MAQTQDLQVIAPTIPPGSCLDPAIVTLIAKTRVLFPAEYSLFIASPNEPTVDQRDYLWVKLDSITNEITGIFTWSGLYGIWLKPHWPNGEPSNERRVFVGSTDALLIYDGGENATTTVSTGPFWEEDKAASDLGTDYPAGLWIKTTGRKYDRSV